jgi:hypothetical protein
MPKNADEFVPETMTENEIARAMGGDIVKSSGGTFSDDEAIAIKSWADIDALLSQHEYETVLADEVLGDGFQIMSTDDKYKLIGMPMHILDWQFHDGKMGGFVSARVIVKSGVADHEIQKWRIADGSHGIYQDLRKLSAKLGRTHSVSVRRGLRVSEYDVEVEQNGKQITLPSKTFYLDISA